MVAEGRETEAGQTMNKVKRLNHKIPWSETKYVDKHKTELDEKNREMSLSFIGLVKGC